MRRYLVILLLCLSAVWNMLSAQASATEMTTEGVDFWVTFMTNNGKSTQKPADLPTINLTIMAVANEAVTIAVDGPTGSRLGTITIPAGGGSGKLEKIAPAAAYLDPSDGETVASKGLHIYAVDGKTKFTCYAMNKAGEGTGTTRDAAMLIPTEYLDKEYYVQTYPEGGGASTEFVVVATEDDTQIDIVPHAQTSNGVAAGTTISVNLSRGEVYMVSSATSGSNINMSGSKVCADKPVAVFQGNEATKVASGNIGGYSPNHTFEQAMPQKMWGSEFYFGLAAHTSRNYFYVTAAYDNTSVTIKRGSMAAVNFTLSAGQSITQALFIGKVGNNNVPDVKITSTKPVMCCTYMSCGLINQEEIYDPITFEPIASYAWGNPTNALLPSWSMRAKNINFYVDTIPTEVTDEVQKMYVQVMTKTSDVDKLSLDGVAVDETEFDTLVADDGMAYINIELTTVGKHTLSSTGDGFVGFVYSMTSETRAYQYTLGFNPEPYRDSLFIANTENVMSPKSYDLSRLSQGWYQRQFEEWPIGEERLDTAYVCDSTVLDFFGQLSNPNINDSVVWKIYRCDEDGKRIEPAIAEQKSTTIGTLNHEYSYQFTLDPQKSLRPHERAPFELFAVDMEKYHKHIICPELDDDADTLHTMVRVNRQYNDTILRRVVCITDTVKCFNDDAGHTTVSAASKQTVFMSRDKLPTGDDFVEGFDLDYNVYKRHYQTVNGCDSIMWFELWVCDTVRIILDTTICENEPLKFDGSLFFQNTNFNHAGTYLDTIKTHNCDGLKTIDPTFKGCDSIFQVNLTICPIYRDTMEVTYCSHGDWSKPYKWYRKGVETPEQFIMDIAVSESDQKDTKYFSDTLKTKTCPDCHNHGCDSIFVLKLYIAPYYKYTNTDAYCGQSYVPVQNANGDYIGFGSLVDNTYTWFQHETHTVWDSNNSQRILASKIQEMELGTTNTFIDSMKTVDGCDSIYELTLTRNRAFFQQNQYTIPNNEVYTWHNNVYGPYEDWNDTIIYLRDPNATTTVNNCDSVWMLELQISQSFKRVDYHVICDDSVFVWTDHESRVTVPSHLDAGHYIFPDSMKMIRNGIECDSIWILDLTVNPTYKKYDTIYICDKDTFTWQNIHYAGNKAPATPSFTPVITLPLGLYEDSVHYSTISACDSAHYLVVYTHKTYNFTESAVVCQDSNYVWVGHENHPLTDENGDPVVISTAVDGVYTYIDHLYTTDCEKCNGDNHGCDSIYTLTLTVNPTYTGDRMIIVEDTICSLDVPYIWTGHTYKDGSQMSFNQSTTIRDTLPTKGCDCDSVVELRLFVVPNAPQLIERTVCQTVEPFTIGAQQKYFSPADSAAGTYVFDAIIPVAGGCQYTETVIVHVDSAYTDLHEERATCQAVGNVVTWRGQTIDISNDGIYQLVDSQKTKCCECDSVTTFTLTVYPSYKQDSSAEMSDEMIINWDGYVYVGENSNVAPGTTVEAYITKDTLITHTYYLIHGPLACDSVRTLNIRFGKIFRDTIHGTTCANLPFEWVGKDQYGNDSTRMTIPVSGLKNDSIYADRHRTVLDFDSIYFLHLHVNPYYPVAPERTTVASVCQGNTYDWPTHVGKSYTIQNTGNYVFYDSLTSQYGCDSVWKLELRVDSIYHYTDQIVLCDNDTISWENRLFVGANFAGTYDASQYHRVHSGLTVASTNIASCDTTYSTIHNCDSTRTLSLLVNPTFLQVAAADTAYRHICDNDTLHYYDGAYNLNGEWRTGDHSIGRQVLTYMDSTRLGCDSLAAMVVYVHPTWLLHSNDTITCRNSSFIWPEHEGHTLYCPERHAYYTTIPTDVDGTLTFVDSLKTVSCPDCNNGVGCDSVWTIKLTVMPTYSYQHQHSMSDESVYFWEHKLYVGEKVNQDTISDALFHGETEHQIVVAPVGLNIYDTLYHTAIYNCDSLETLQLKVGPTYRDTLHDQHTCINEPYIWHRSGELTDRTITPTQTMIGNLSYFSDTLLTKEFGFDSIFILELKVHDIHIMPIDKDTVCRNSEYHWYDANGKEHTEALYGENHIHYTAIPTDTAGWITIYDSLKTVTCPTCQSGSGCDSVHILQLYVAPTPRIPHRKTISDEEVYFWEHKLYVGEKVNQDTISDALFHGETEHIIVVAQTGVNLYDTLYHTQIFDCDSVEELTLLVGPTYRDTLHDQHTCINEPYIWYRNGELTNRTITPTPGMIDNVSYFSDTLFTKEFGFDSIFILELKVHDIHIMPIDYDTVCQDGEYSWHNKVVPTANAGWVTVYDSLKTKTCPTCQSGVGCDSIHQLQLYVAPTYHKHETGELCDNTTYTWQRILYVGAKYDTVTYGKPAKTSLTYDTVIYLPDRSQFLDTAYYHTTLLCDSNYYLDLTINHSEFYLLRDKISDNNTTWSFGHGSNYHRGVDYMVSDLSDTLRVPRQYLLIDTVKTAEGCDIIYHDSLTVYPEYRFVLDTFTCSNESFNWRKYNELNHRSTGFYYDSLKTKAGFDSVYVLYLNIIPGFEATHNREFCKNDTIYWQQKKLYWDPFDGDQVVNYKAQYSRGGGCDSVYNLNVWYKNYYHYPVKIDTICRFDEYHWMEDDGTEHTKALRGEHGERFTSVPTDTVGLITLYDSLRTSASCHCDSTFTLQLYVKPAYHFYETHEPICSGTTVEWRGQIYSSDVATVITDTRSFRTTGDCDSVFHFSMEVYQSYDFVTDSVELCADYGHYEWHGISFDEYLQRSINERHTTDDTIIKAKIYNTVLDCDSTYHIHLVIHPVLWTEWDDTICSGESYKFNNRILTQQNTYYDTTYTEFGCPQYEVVNLAVVPATRFSVFADSACADYGQYVLRVNYDGLRPDSFAIYYDSLAHARGFVDILKDTFVDNNIQLTIPQATPFLRPDNYKATLFFFTRHCIEDSTMMQSYTLQVRYPSSILAQHWNDMIAIYDSAYNGGYKFDNYQWFYNDDIMPGQTAHFLYQPHWLENGETYSVRLTRVGEDYGIMTCPITISWDSDNKVTPTMQYLSVVPTAVSKDYPLTNILSLIEGDYKVISPTGSTILSGRIVPDEHHAMYVNLPAVEGMYVVEMHDDDGNSRNVKVMVY